MLTNASPIINKSIRNTDGVDGSSPKGIAKDYKG